MMQFLVAFLVLGTIVYAGHLPHAQQISEDNASYGYMEIIGIPEAEKIRKVEEAGSRIVGGLLVALGQYPFKAGILADITIGDQVIQGVCGGSLVSARRVFMPAHCWFDGHHQAQRLTISLGTVYLFGGGIRVQTTVVALHPNYNPRLLRDDVAIAYLPTPVPITANVAPVYLPSGSDLFAGERAIAVGYGITDGSIPSIFYLNHVNVTVIPNSDCSLAYPFIQNSNICTIGFGGGALCYARSGTPLIINRNNRQILIGMSIFASAQGCQSGMPHGFARVTSYSDFIRQHILSKTA